MNSFKAKQPLAVVMKFIWFCNEENNVKYMYSQQFFFQHISVFFCTCICLNMGQKHTPPIITNKRIWFHFTFKQFVNFYGSQSLCVKATIKFFGDKHVQQWCKQQQCCIWRVDHKTSTSFLQTNRQAYKHFPVYFLFASFTYQHTQLSQPPLHCGF